MRGRWSRRHVDNDWSSIRRKLLPVLRNVSSNVSFAKPDHYTITQVLIQDIPFLKIRFPMIIRAILSCPHFDLCCERSAVVLVANDMDAQNPAPATELCYGQAQLPFLLFRYVLKLLFEKFSDVIAFAINMQLVLIGVTGYIFLLRDHNVEFLDEWRFIVIYYDEVVIVWIDLFSVSDFDWISRIVVLHWACWKPFPKIHSSCQLWCRMLLARFE